jgi:glycosyltransferase involved in cell wall biosynthesis
VKIAFVLPGPAAVPVGGTRVVYRLAAGLVDLGHRVSILHPVAWLGSPTAHRSYPVALASWVKHLVLRDFLPRSWLPTDRRVTLRVIPSISARWVGRNDVVVANGWRTMAPVADLPPESGRRIVYVQHMETWDASPQQLDAAWQLPLHHVATSDWLVEESRKRGRTADKVPVGVDHDLFFVEVPPERRVKPIVALLGHDLDWKGTAVALAAVELARREFPELVAEVFCSRPPRWPVPSGVRLSIDPGAAGLRALYNSAQVFIAPSFSEGWDLPACEAMACGAALVASAIPVRSEYAAHGEQALLVNPGDPEALATAVMRLLGDVSLRLRLAHAGQQRVTTLTWPTSARLFDIVLQRLAGAAPATARRGGRSHAGAGADSDLGGPERV